MKLPMGFGQLDFSDWIRGLVSGFISGGANAISAAFVAPALSPDLAVGTSKFFIMVGSMFLMSGTLSMMNYLRTKPIPDLKTVTSATAVISQAGTSPTIIKTVTESHIEAGSAEGGGPKL